MIDAHAHLGTDAHDVLERARAVGVTRVVDVATTVPAARLTLERAERQDGVYACLGIHPHEAGGDADLDTLRELLAHPRAVAVGETGLDYFRDYAPRDAQRRLFEDQLALADELGKPVVIHTRAADDDTRVRLLAHDGPVILHCFSSPGLLPDALERGWYVSFAGNVTYKNAGDLREAARRVASERLLAETDSPYLAPQPVRGRTNEPANVVHTLRALAEARHIDPAELAAQIDANADAVFGLSRSVLSRRLDGGEQGAEAPASPAPERERSRRLDRGFEGA
ncbi:MAG: TatD family hydrolase [Gaiellaceae bacterium]